MLVGIAAEFRVGIQSLVPTLLADFASRARSALVQRVDGVKVDLAVEAVLQSRCDIICVIVGTVAMAVVVAVALVFVVAVRHDAGSALVRLIVSSHVCDFVDGDSHPRCPFMSLLL